MQVRKAGRGHRQVLRRRQLLRSLGGLAAGALLARTSGILRGNEPRVGGRAGGRIVLPQDPGYDRDRLDFNKRFDIYPQAIVYCAGADDVASAITWARSQNLPLAVRSGGHSYEAFSLSPGVVIDLSAMNAVDLSGSLVVAQSGVRLLPFYHVLAAQGVTVPGGTCEGVGLGGLTLGGGAGFLTRKWGLTSDNLVGLEMVDAEGRLLQADASRNADLFWACRGGGGSFGVVTQFSFNPHPIGDVVVITLTWPHEQAAAVLASWQSLAPFWPDELTSSLQIDGSASGGVSLDGLFLGDQGDVDQHLNPLLTAASPKDFIVQTTDYGDAADHFSGQSKLPYFKAKSDFVRAPLSPDAINVIIDWMARSPGEGDQIQFQAYGGAVNRIPRDATPFPHRAGTLYSIQYMTHWADPSDEDASLNWLRDFYANMRPYVSGGAYSNMADLDLADWPAAYYGENFERLAQVKSVYDPENIFRFGQSIPPNAISADSR